MSVKKRVSRGTTEVSFEYALSTLVSKIVRKHHPLIKNNGISPFNPDPNSITQLLELLKIEAEQNQNAAVKYKWMNEINKLETRFAQSSQ